MNANELADVLEDLHEQDKIDGVAHLAMPKAADMLRQQQAEIEALKAFVKPILVHSGDGVGDWDGYELQELAVKSGLFIEKTMTEPCNLGKEETEGCLCREYCYGEESWECYRINKFLLDEDISNEMA